MIYVTHYDTETKEPTGPSTPVGEGNVHEYAKTLHLPLAFEGKRIVQTQPDLTGHALCITDYPIKVEAN